MEILAISAVFVIMMISLILLIACVYAASEWTENFWIICLTILATYFVAHFIIDFAIFYCQSIWSQKG